MAQVFRSISVRTIVNLSFPRFVREGVKDDLRHHKSQVNHQISVPVRKFAIWAFTLFFSASITACTDSKLEEVQTRLAKTEKAMAGMQAHLESLEKELADAQKAGYRLQNEKDAVVQKLERIRQENQRLDIRFQAKNVQCEDMKQWAHAIVDAHGPSIWYISEFDYPTFSKAMPKAGIKQIIQELNRYFEKDQLPKIIFDRINGKTAYIKVSDENMLTQQMGTSGAESYMKAVLFSLASVGTIDCVWFEFTEGDHAMPGRYCR